MKKLTLALLVLAMLACRPPVAAAQSSEFPEAPDKALVQERCTACHADAQVTSQRRTEAQWAETVDRMINTNSAQITDDEYARIVKYLAANLGPQPAAANAPAACAKTGGDPSCAK